MTTYRGMTVEEIKINGDKGTPISAYTARPSGPVGVEWERWQHASAFAVRRL
jgi:hypothetical protein